MPPYQTESYATTGVKASLALDTTVAPLDVTIAATLVAGSVSYKLEYSLDPSSVSDADALWFESADIPAGTDASAVASFSFPANRVRVDIASIATGPLILQVLQAA